jgi:PAS domain S-box-containing protein
MPCPWNRPNRSRPVSPGISASRRWLGQIPETESSRQLTQLKAALDEHAIVATTDTRGRITYVNEKFCEISQYAREELLGQTHRIINSGVHPSEFFHTLWQTITQGRVWKGEICNRAKDGSLYWVETTIVPFMDAQGNPCEYIALRTDVTVRKQQQEELVGLLEAKLRTLEGILPICGYCKDIRNPDNSWTQLEEYISHRSHADFSHTICPKCMRKHYPNVNSSNPLQD